MKKTIIGGFFLVLLSACGSGSGVPSAQDLLNKTNQALKCQNQPERTFTQAQLDAVSQSCNDDDRKALDEFLDCSIDIACNQAQRTCTVPTLSEACEKETR